MHQNLCHQVRKQNSCTDDQQDQPTYDLGNAAPFAAYFVSEGNPDTGHQTGNHTDNHAGDPDGYWQEGQTDAHCQSVNTGSHGKGYQGPPPGRTRGHFSFTILPGLNQHLAADVTQQAEGHPMIVFLDDRGYGPAGQPSDEGHHELKQTEMK